MGHDRLDALLAYVVEHEGSDLHIKVGSPPKLRLNGSLTALPDEATLTPAETAEMARAIMNSRISEEFEHRNDSDFAYSAAGVGRFRANAFRQRGSVAMVFRHVKEEVPTIDSLQMPGVVETLADEPRGMVLVTGPTGSGKTTTLAAVIDHINTTRQSHIVTIEDPIEFLHRDKESSINQREIGVDSENFLTAMRAAMRQDPDVILVGEMRDEETVRAALSAAETGHFVLSTLHTIDATETVNRIIDFFPPHQQKQVRHALAGSLRGTLCQRLVRTIDGEGRVAAIEAMVVTGRVAQCIIDPALTGSIPEIVADGDYYGMQTFDQALAELFSEGRISLGDAITAATSPHDLKVRLQSMGLLDSSMRPTGKVGHNGAGSPVAAGTSPVQTAAPGAGISAAAGPGG